MKAVECEVMVIFQHLSEGTELRHKKAQNMQSLRYDLNPECSTYE